MKCNFLEHHVCIRTTGEYRLCCSSMESNNKETIHTHTPEEWLQSSIIQNSKNLLSQNIWPESCFKCKNEEKNGRQSMRLRPEEYGPEISHLDLRFNNNCNLQCIMCNPMSSSSILKEHNDLIIQGIDSPWINLAGNSYNWYTDKKGNSFSNLPYLKEIYLTGGEPMMVKNLDKFLKKLDSSITLRFNTNGTIVNPKILKELKRFKKINMCVSIDGIGKVNDYIRWGSDWNSIEHNINQYSDICEINIGPTIQVMNILYYDDLREWCDKRNFKVYNNILFSPEWLNIQNSPKKLKDQIKNFHTGNEIDSSHNEFLFKKYITILDKRRSINIRDFIPKVAEAYNFN